MPKQQAQDQIKHSSTSRKAIAGAVIFWFCYLFAPFLAPILMKLGFTSQANFIYTVYSALCHQRSERSIFIFGDQFNYSVNDLKKMGIFNFWESRDFRGDEEIGYKVAFCFRDTGIYLGLFLTASLFLIKPDIVKKPLKLKYVAIGVLPMILDGVIQLIAEICVNVGLNTKLGLPAATPFYVSNNLKRIVTGFLFGVTIGFWLYPSIINEF